MVGDKRTPSRKKLRRRTSWKDTIRGFASGGDEEEELPTQAVKAQPSSGRKPIRRSFFLAPKSNDEGTESEEEDFHQWKEEDRPLQARVRYVYPPSTNPEPIPAPLVLSGSAMERHQEELTAAVNEANIRVSESKERSKAIGTRLTMTSRTGYFQDRIISPSMVRNTFCHHLLYHNTRRTDARHGDSVYRTPS